jgi:hypothetical protein
MRCDDRSRWGQSLCVMLGIALAAMAASFRNALKMKKGEGLWLERKR